MISREEVRNEIDSKLYDQVLVQAVEAINKNRSEWSPSSNDEELINNAKGNICNKIIYYSFVPLKETQPLFYIKCDSPLINKGKNCALALYYDDYAPLRLKLSVNNCFYSKTPSYLYVGNDISKFLKLIKNDEIKLVLEDSKNNRLFLKWDLKEIFNIENNSILDPFKHLPKRENDQNQFTQAQSKRFELLEDLDLYKELHVRLSFWRNEASFSKEAAPHIRMAFYEVKIWVIEECVEDLFKRTENNSHTSFVFETLKKAKAFLEIGSEISLKKLVEYTFKKGRSLANNSEILIYYCNVQKEILSATENDNPIEISLLQDVISILLKILLCGWNDPESTKEGLSVKCILPSTDLDKFEVSLSDFVQDNRFSCDVIHKLAINSWRFRHYRIPYLYNLFIKAEDSASFDVKINLLPFISGDEEEFRSLNNDIFHEAKSLKKWTIPWGAHVKTDNTYFPAIKLFEINKRVYVFFIDQKGQFIDLCLNFEESELKVDRKTLESYFVFPFHSTEIASFEVASQIQKTNNLGILYERCSLAFINLALRVVRDFWVVEERERVFGKAIQIKSTSKLKSELQKKVLVYYLPRIRYLTKSSEAKSLKDSFEYGKRAIHEVSGHLRKAENPSARQVALALRDNISLQPGYTYVTPHRRGHLAVERVFRSRSINEIWFDNKEFGSEKDDWFTFERKTEEWLQKNNFEIINRSVRGWSLGGQPIDIQALRDDLHLFVQCKFGTTPVGPSVVTHMVGALADFPVSQKHLGVIVTTSYLTSGAKEEAGKQGILFFEHVDFSKINLQLPAD